MTVTHFNSGLQSLQYDKLRGTSYQGNRLVSLFSNRVVFAAQIATDLSVLTSWAELTFYNVTVGAWSDVIEGQAVVISDANDITTGDFYRTRLVPTSSIFYPNESSQNFSAGAYIWVIDNYLPQYKLSRPSTSDPTTEVELVDYNTVYQAMLPIVRGLQTGYAGYVNSVTGKLRLGFDVSQSLAAQSGATIASTNFAFAGATVVAGALNQSIVIVDLDYGEQWGGCAVVDSGGRGTTRRFGIKVHDPDLYEPDTGFEGGTISATLEQGYTLSIPAFAGVDDVLNNTFAIVWRANESYNGTAGDLYGSGVWGDITNKQLTSSLATLTSVGHSFVAGQTIIVADVGAPFDGTWVIISTTTDTFSYTCTASNVASTPCSGMGIVNPQNVDFVGWLNREDDPVQSSSRYSVISTARFTFTGVGPRLARLTAQLLAFIQSTSPTRWGDITNLTPWRAIWHFLSRYTTLGNLCDVWFDSTDNTYLFPAIDSQGGNALATIQDIAQLIDANIEFAPWGAIGINKDVNFTHTGTVIGQWTAADLLEFTRSYDPNPTIGKVDADGAFYNATSAQVTDYTGRAPGIAQGEAEGSDSFPNRILASTTSTAQAKAELFQRTGDRFEFDNLREFIDGTHPDGYVGASLMPSRSQVYTLTLTATLAGSHGVNRVIYTSVIQWTIESISIAYDEKRGTFVVKPRYRRVTITGDPADDTTIVLPAPGEIPEMLPDLGLPAFNFDLPELTFPDIGLLPSEVPPAALLPPPGKVAWFDGRELIAWGATVAFFLRQMLVNPPLANEITPSDLGGFEIVQIVVDPFFTNNAIPAYLLATDGDNSAIWYTANVAVPVPTWVKGTEFSGAFSVLRATKTAGSALVYNVNTTSGAWTHTFDFTTGTNGFTENREAINMGGGQVNGVGWTPWDEQDGPGNWHRHLYISRAFSPNIDFTNYSGTYTVTRGTNFGGDFDNLAIDSTPYDQINTPLPSGTLTRSASGAFTSVASIDFNSYVSGAGTQPGLTGSEVLPSLILAGDGTDPFGGGGNTGAVVRLVEDYGETVNAELPCGDSPGLVGGFDVQRSGTNSFAAADGAVVRATTLGGSYSSYYTPTGGAQAICIIVPYRTWAGARNTANANPDIIVGLNAPDGSSRTLLWIEGGATPGTVHDLTPVANFIFTNPNSITSSYEHHIIVTGTVSGAAKCYRTTNRGSSWSEVTGRTSPTFVRTRRNDNRAIAGSGINKGQCYIMDNGVLGFTSVWASANFLARTMPTSGLVGIETIW